MHENEDDDDQCKSDWAYHVQSCWHMDTDWLDEVRSATLHAPTKPLDVETRSSLIDTSSVFNSYAIFAVQAKKARWNLIGNVEKVIIRGGGPRV